MVKIKVSDLPEALVEPAPRAVPAQGGPGLRLGRGVHGAEAAPAAARQLPRVLRSPGGVGVVWMGWHLKNWRHGRQVTAPKWSPVSWRPEGALLTPSSEGWGGMGPHTAHTATILVFFSEKISLDVYPKGK